jgi:hypothetical protein
MSKYKRCKLFVSITLHILEDLQNSAYFSGHHLFRLAHQQSGLKIITPAAACLRFCASAIRNEQFWNKSAIDEIRFSTKIELRNYHMDSLRNENTLLSGYNCTT